MTKSRNAKHAKTNGAKAAKDIVITLTISPIANGKRKLIVSGAPEQEMPVVRVGAFADLHRLIDETWLEMMKRKPQVVTVKKETPKSQSKPTPKKTEEKEADEGDQSVEGKDEAPDPAEKDIDDQTAPNPDVPEPEEQLPLIEGDETVEEIEHE